MSIRRTLAIALIAMAACSDHSTTSPPSEPERKVAQVEVLAGEGQVSSALFFPINPKIRATDAFGAPVPGALAAFSVRDTGSFIVTYKLPIGYARTDSNGIATVAGWHSGPVGTAVLDVDVDGIKTTITATALPTSPLTISAVGAVDLGAYPPGTTLPITFSAAPYPQFEVRDATGRLVNEAQVQFAAGPIGGLVERWTALTYLGFITPRWTLGESLGDYQLTASIASVAASHKATVVPSAPLSFSTVVAGSSHSCGATVGKRVFCWGSNRAGQLRDTMSVANRLSPFLVYSAQFDYAVTAVANYTCVFDKPLSRSGSLTCWGTGPYEVPRAGEGQLDSSIRDQRNGQFHACAVTSERFDFYCWGANQYGQVGDGTTTSRPSPVKVPIPVGVDYPWSLVIGVGHTCIATRGHAYCWGKNDMGQLGEGTTTSRTVPTEVAGNLPFVSIAAGASHSCGILSDQRALCWGSNANGQLGIGEFGGSRIQPTPVAGGRTFTWIAAGDSHTCAIEAGTNRAYCWGLNSDGQLGDGTTISRSAPTPVADYRP